MRGSDFHTFHTCSPRYGNLTALIRKVFPYLPYLPYLTPACAGARPRVHVRARTQEFNFPVWKVWRYGRTATGAGFRAPYLLHTSLRYGTHGC